MDKRSIIQIIEDKYIYYMDLDTNIKIKLHNLYRVKEDEIFYKELQKLLATFRDPHTKLIKSKEYFLPICLAIVDKEIVVVENSKEYGKIKKGFVLKKIDYIDINEILKEYFSGTDSVNLKLKRILEYLAASEKDKEIILTFETAMGKKIEEKIDYIRMKHYMYEIKKYFDILEKHKKNIERKYNVSYYYCSSLMNDLEINTLLYNLKNRVHNNDIILDIRNNIGGKIELAIKLTEFFISSKKVFFLKSRDHIKKFQLNPQKSEVSDKNIGILFNGLTSSSLEFIFLRLIKDEKNIVFLGTSTCGMNDVASVYKLNNNYVMTLTTKQYVDDMGEKMKIRNIEPHIYIKDNDTNNIGNDIQLIKAIEFLKNKKE